SPPPRRSGTLGSGFRLGFVPSLPGGQPLRFLLPAKGLERAASPLPPDIAYQQVKLVEAVAPNLAVATHPALDRTDVDEHLVTVREAARVVGDPDAPHPGVLAAQVATAGPSLGL